MRKELYGLSDVGMIRIENEDSFLIRSFGDIDLLIVADGMGGHVGGKVASGLAVETIERFVENNHLRLNPQELISDAMALAHRRILERRRKEPSLDGMGTTCTIALLLPYKEADGLKKIRVVYGHIGDSKLNHISREGIRQLTTDHTLIQRMLDSRAISYEESKSSAHRGVIYKSLGGTDQLDLDPPQSFVLKSGEAVLLCSDGLSGYLEPEELRRILRASSGIESAARYMIDLAKERGGDDNITVAIASLDTPPPDRSIVLKTTRGLHQHKKATHCSKRRGWLILFSVLLVFLVALLIFLLLRPIPDDKPFEQVPAVPLTAPEGQTTPKPAEKRDDNVSVGLSSIKCEGGFRP